MKTRLATGMLALSLASAAHAQWLVAGTSIYYNGGNVGIGTANPAHPLDVRSFGDRAVSATNYKENGYTYGVYGVVRSSAGRGIYGLANNTGGTGYGVLGVSNGRTGHGVHGYAQDNHGGASYGVSGKAESVNGAGVLGEAVRGIGVIGTSDARTAGTRTGAGSIAGTQGIITSTSPGAYSSGVWGINNGTNANGSGVAGYHAGDGIGVYGAVGGDDGFAGYFVGGRNYFEGQTGFGVGDPTAQVDVAGDVRLRTEDRLYFGGATENDDPVYFERNNGSADNSVLRLVIGDDDAAGNSRRDWFIITTRNLSGGSQHSQIWLGSDGSAFKPGGGAWSALSDRRAKHDIRPLRHALDRLMKLHGVTFEYNDPTARGAAPGVNTGFIAQEVEPIFPEWVGEYDGMKTLTIRGFEALAVESLRELRAEKDSQIAELRAQTDNEISQLRSENAELRARLERIESLVAGRH